VKASRGGFADLSDAISVLGTTKFGAVKFSVSKSSNAAP
jgi:hypothetical protein